MTDYSDRVKLLEQSPVLLNETLMRVVRAMAQRDPVKEDHAFEELSSVFARTMALADLLGRKRVIMEYDALPSRSNRRSPHVMHFASFCRARFGVRDAIERPSRRTFDQAFNAVMEAEPRLRPFRDELEKTYGLGLYKGTSRLVNFVSKQAKTEMQLKLHGHILRLGKRGVPQEKAVKQLADMFDATHAYADTAYRTVIAGAHTGGMFREAQSPDTKQLMPAFEVNSVFFPTSRMNHKAGNGFLAGVDDPIWEDRSPPYGFNCMCWLRSIPRFELEERGLIAKNGTVQRWYPSTFARFKVDDGFRSEPPTRRYVL